MKRTLALFALIGCLFAPAAFAQGQDQGWRNQFSPSEARDAVKEGRIVKWRTIEADLVSQYGGYLGGFDLYERDDGSAYYKVDWYTADGRQIQFTINAQNGSVIDRRGE